MKKICEEIFMQTDVEDQWSTLDGSCIKTIEYEDYTDIETGKVKLDEDSLKQKVLEQELL